MRDASKTQLDYGRFQHSNRSPATAAIETGFALDEAEVESHVTQSIVVRLWLENPESPQRPSDWRARLTHVPTGDSRTVDSLNGIAGFCAARLVAVNARLRWYERIWLRLTRRSAR